MYSRSLGVQHITASLSFQDAQSVSHRWGPKWSSCENHCEGWCLFRRECAASPCLNPRGRSGEELLMTQPRALEPVLGGGRLLGLRARGSRGACLGLSNSPVAGFTLCRPTALSWFTASPAAEMLVSPTGQPPQIRQVSGAGALCSGVAGMDPGTAQLPHAC